MHKLAAAFALLASPALATGLRSRSKGEGANGTITVDLFEDRCAPSMWNRSPRWPAKVSMMGWCSTA